MSIRKKMKEEADEIAALRVENQVRKFCKKWKLKIEYRFEALVLIAAALYDSHDVLDSLARTKMMVLTDDAEIGALVLDYLERSAQSMTEIADELNSLANEARGEKARLQDILKEPGPGGQGSCRACTPGN